MVFLSNIVDKGLVPYEKWESYIDSLTTKKTIKNEKEAVDKLREVFLNAIEKRLPNEKFGIFFSGGVDSSLIALACKRFNKKFTCYTVGVGNSKDVVWSERVARELGLDYKIKIFELEEMETLFKNTAVTLGPELINIINLGVGSVELAAIKFAKKDNLKFLFSGLGSEEIFAGYRRHENAEKINQECWYGLKTMWKRDFLREYTLATKKKVELLTPFLDKELIKIAMQIPGEMKIKKRYKKYILRKMALSLGLKKEFAFRPKKAAQYGSNFDKALLKITKKHNYKYKKEYLSKLKKLSKDK